jgi:hypothetical protein
VETGCSTPVIHAGYVSRLIADGPVFFPPMMLAETATQYIRILYSAEVFSIIEAQAGRAISNKAERRGKLTELLVVNCPVARVVQLELLGGNRHHTVVAI